MRRTSAEARRIIEMAARRQENHGVGVLEFRISYSAPDQMPMDVTPLVKRKIAQTFPRADAGTIADLLKLYNPDSTATSNERVQLAILKLSNGDEAALLNLISVAQQDSRDVIAGAEYPREMRFPYIARSRLSPDELDELRRLDRQEYEEWLQK